MEIKIPEIRQEIRLCEYAPEFGEQALSVRVNPSRAVLAELRDLQKKMASDQALDTSQRFVEILAGLWACTPEEVLKLVTYAQDTDPKFFSWLVIRSLKMINEHRSAIKKK